MIANSAAFHLAQAPQTRRKNGRPKNEENQLYFEQFDLIRQKQAALLAGYMLLRGISFAAIRFMIMIYPLFLSQKEVNQRKMAAAYECSPQAASKHIQHLTEAGFLDRVGYRAWAISTDYLTSLNTV